MLPDPIQPYELTVEERSGYLYARLTAASIDEATARSYLNELADRCMKKRVDRVMIYRNIPDVLDTTRMYFAATLLHKLMAGVKVAWVNPYASNEKMLQFAATVSFNIGERHEIFNDEEKAERWLLGS